MTWSKEPVEKPVEEVFRKEKVGLLCRTEPPIAFPDTPLAETVAKLRGDSGGCVIIVEPAPGPRSVSGETGTGSGGPGRPVGVFTERDYLDKVALRDLPGVPTSRFMTPNPRTLSCDDSLDAAIQLMTKGGYRHLPLVDGDGLLVGSLSARDIIAYLAEFFPVEVMNLPSVPDHGIPSREGE